MAEGDDSSREVGAFDALPTQVETPATKQVAQLEQRLTKEQDDHAETKFWYGGTASLLALIALSPQIDGALWVIILPLYVAALAIFAKKQGVDEAVVALSAVWAKIMPHKDKSD